MKYNYTMSNIEQILYQYYKYTSETGRLTETSAKNYVSYIREANEVLNNNLLTILLDFINEPDHINLFMNSIEKSISKFSNSSKVKSALKSFAYYIYGTFYGNDALSLAIDDFSLAKIVAETSIFADPKVVEKVKKGELGTRHNILIKGNPYASWDGMSSTRFGKTDLPRSDQRSNTIPNYGMKLAIINSLELTNKLSYRIFKDYQTCHIWQSNNDPRFFTSIQNLVLVPRPIATLTDHNEYVKSVLQYRAYRLFGFNPTPHKIERPKRYSDLTWRNLPF